MASNKKYFRSIEELKNPQLTETLAEKEFSEEIPVEDFIEIETILGSEITTSRRDFLKFLGFSTAAATLAACQEPVIKSVPYVVKPASGIIPGVPNYYASTMFNGFDFTPVLVKTREGRPIKIEVNSDAKLFGSNNARTQASVLSLYDNNRLKQPKLNSENSNWKTVDNYVINGLNKTKNSAKKIVILTSSFPSPSTQQLISDFISKYPNSERVVYDDLSYSPALDAAETVFGQRVLPIYDLSKAKTIVSFNADFLNDWNGGHMEEGYAKAKVPSKDMVKHIQVESNLSLSGANADIRIPLKPTEVYKTLTEVYKAINGGNTNDKNAQVVIKAIQTNPTSSVVFAEGSKEAYILSHLINQKIGSQVLSNRANLTKESNDTKFNQFLSQLQSGQVGMLMIFGANPVYSHQKGKQIADFIKKVPFSVSMSIYEDETTKVTKANAPVPHWLESWGDFIPATGVYTISQPTIQKIFDTRQFQDSLLKWMGQNELKNVLASSTPIVKQDSITQTTDSAVVNTAQTIVSDVKNPTYYDYLKNFYSTKEGGLGVSFEQALYTGYVETAETASLSASGDGNSSVQQLLSIKPAKFELQLYTKVGIGDGKEANNPWLQELPDPLTRVSWDNYITMHPQDAEDFGFNNNTVQADLNGRMQFNGNYVNLKVNGQEVINVPVFVQPGQAKGSIGLALGYGQDNGGASSKTGVNAYALFIKSSLIQPAVEINKTDGMHEFACMQLQNTLMGRYEIAREVDLNTYLNSDVEQWNKPLTMHTYTAKEPIKKIDLWQKFDDSDGPHFNLSVDLNSCTGCGACVIACQAENNVAVVGKDEMRMNRDMYWLRIDRYFSNDLSKSEADKNKDNKLTQEEAIDDNLNEPQQYKLLIAPAQDNPQVTFQPVMCQHCNHAPCESVCPVAATSHGKQGQNQMAYNRCVGTRYCANNCPYKVRRFNWFNYALNDKFDFNMNNDLGRMVLNPDIVVRTRGVMEKCSMCIQLTQATILEAKKAGRAVKDGEFQTACTKVCATGALQFGDVNDPNANINKLVEDKRKYVLLEDVGTKPNVIYQYKIRNNS